MRTKCQCESCKQQRIADEQFKKMLEDYQKALGAGTITPTIYNLTIDGCDRNWLERIGISW